MLRPFTVSWEGVLHGTPEQAWEAMARQSAAWIWEIDYEPRPDGTLLRCRHQSVSDDVGWIELVEECSEHTDFHLHWLGEYVRWFAGRKARYVGIDGRDRWDDPSMIALHLFDPAADAKAIQRDWRAWLTTTANTTEKVA